MTKPFTSGSGGSGPKNSRDSLFSGDAVEVVLGISEGPIEGIKGATIEEKLKNVFLDGTPILTESGSKSFEESQIIINFEPGTPVTEVEDPDHGQTPIPYLLGGTATPVGVSSTLEQNVAITRTVPSIYRNKYSKIEVRIMVSRLANLTKDGAKDLSARIRIEHKKAADVNWMSETHTITGKTLSGGFVRSFEFFVADTSQDIDLRVVALDLNDPESTVRDLFWLNYELSDALVKDGVVQKEYHPGTAMMTFVSKIGENFNRIPGLTAVWRGLLCKVPSNYDPVTRTYNETSPWDGTFKAQRAWTNNPIWLVRELITNPRFGMARYNPRVTLDDFSIYDEAKYADTPREVDGKTIPLFTFNGVIRDPILGLELINFILGSANAQAIEYASGFLKIVSDRNVSAVMDVTPEMCVQQESGIIFNYSASALKERPNEIQATYVEPNLDWQEQYVGPFRNAEAQETQGVNIYEFKAIGCTNVYEATYKAFYRLISAQTEVLTCTFTVPLMAIGWEIYDIINIVDPDMDWGMSGRATSVIGTNVTLRDRLYFEATGTYDFVLQTQNGTTVTHTFNIPSVGSYQSLTLSTAVTEPLAQYPAFSVQRAGASPGTSKPFRIVAITRVEGSAHLRAITCVEVNRNKWQQALDGVLGDKPRYNFEQPRMPKGPRNLSYLGEASLVTNGKLRPLARLQWDAEIYRFLGLSYAVFVSENGDPFYEAAVTRTNYYEFPIARDVVYQFYVQLRYQDLKLNSNVLDWQSYRLRPIDIVESNLTINIISQFNLRSLSIFVKALYQLPGTDKSIDLLEAGEVSGVKYELIGTVNPPSGASYQTLITSGTQTSSEIILTDSSVLNALYKINGAWELRVRLVSSDSEALDNTLPYKWAVTPAGSGGSLWQMSRNYAADGQPLTEWMDLQNLTNDKQIEFSADGNTWVTTFNGTEKFYRLRTVTIVNSAPVYGPWDTPINFVDYSTVATHNRYIFVYSSITPPAYNEFPWEPRVLTVLKPQFPSVQGISLTSSSKTISGELSTSGGTIPVEVEWWVADSEKVPDTTKPVDDLGNHPLKVQLNPRRLAHTGPSMYSLYVGKSNMECRVWVRFQASGYYSGFYPSDVLDVNSGTMVPGVGVLITTQPENFNEIAAQVLPTVVAEVTTALAQIVIDATVDKVDREDVQGLIDSSIADINDAVSEDPRIKVVDAMQSLLADFVERDKIDLVAFSVEQENQIRQLQVLELKAADSATLQRIDGVVIDVKGNTTAISTVKGQVNNPANGLSATFQLANQAKSTAEGAVSSISVIEGVVNNPTTGLTATRSLAQSAKLTADNAATSATEITNTVNNPVTGLSATALIAQQAKSTAESGLSSATAITNVVNNPTTGLSATATVAQQAKSTADGALSTATAVTNVVNNPTTGLSATAAIAQQAKNTADGATESILVIQQSVTNLDGDINAVATVANQAKQTANGAVESIAEVSGVINNGSTGLSATRTLAQSAQQTADGAVVGVSLLGTEVGNLGRGLTATANVAQSAKQTADGATQSISNINNSITDLNNGLSVSTSTAQKALLEAQENDIAANALIGSIVRIMEENKNTVSIQQVNQAVIKEGNLRAQQVLDLRAADRASLQQIFSVSTDLSKTSSVLMQLYGTVQNPSNGLAASFTLAQSAKTTADNAVSSITEIDGTIKNPSKGLAASYNLALQAKQTADGAVSTSSAISGVINNASTGLSATYNLALQAKQATNGLQESTSIIQNKMNNPTTGLDAVGTIANQAKQTATNAMETATLITNTVNHPTNGLSATSTIASQAKSTADGNVHAINGLTSKIQLTDHNLAQANLALQTVQDVTGQINARAFLGVTSVSGGVARINGIVVNSATNSLDFRADTLRLTDTDGNLKLSWSTLDNDWVYSGNLVAATFKTSRSGYRAEMSGAGVIPFWYGTGEKTWANALFGVDSSGNIKISNAQMQGAFVSTTSGVRVEINTGDDYLIWAGSGAKNDSNGTFWIKQNGTGFIKGNFFEGQIIESKHASTYASNAANLSTTISDHNSAGKVIDVQVNGFIQCSAPANQSNKTLRATITVTHASGVILYYDRFTNGVYDAEFMKTEWYLDFPNFITRTFSAGINAFTLSVSYSFSVNPTGALTVSNNSCSIKTFENKLA